MALKLSILVLRLLIDKKKMDNSLSIEGQCNDILVIQNAVLGLKNNCAECEILRIHIEMNRLSSLLYIFCYLVGSFTYLLICVLFMFW